MPVRLNTAPPIEDFCPAAELPTFPVIRFPGGFALEPQVDPTKGVPGACSLVLDLTGKVQGALAPFMPLFQILDFVAHLANCFMLLKDCISNPFKIPDLIACLPGLLGKLNALLALIPVFPQGIIGMVTFVADIIRFAVAMLDCVIGQLNALQQEFVELGRLAETLNRTEDEAAKANLEAMLEAGTAAAETSASTILAALGPIARLLCTVRSLLSIVPGGREIAQKMAFPDPSKITNIGTAIEALVAVRDVLNAAITLLATIGLGIAPLAPPELSFSCALDAPADEAPAVELEEPEISLVLTAAGLPLPPATIPQASPGDPVFRLIINATGITETTQVFWGTVQLQEITFQTTRLVVDVPSDLLTNTGNFYLLLVNVPSGAGAAFSGLSEDPSSPAASGVKLSDQYEVEVS